MVIENSIYKKAYNLAIDEAKTNIFNYLHISKKENQPDLLTTAIADRIANKTENNNSYTSKVTMLDIMKDKIEIPKFFIDSYNRKLEYFKILKNYIGYTFLNYLESCDFYYTVTERTKNSCILYIQSSNFKSVNIIIEVEEEAQKVYKSNIYADDTKIYFKDELEKDLIVYVEANIFGTYRTKFRFSYSS